MSESKKWKAIEKLTNQSSGYGIQPIRITDQGRLRYLFSDSEICHEMEQYHISKSSSSSTSVQDEWFKGQVQIMVQQAHDGQGDAIMNDEINDGEIAMMFGKCSNMPGPDNISASLLDGADRTVMHECLRIIWNKAWHDGYFIKQWKLENRAFLQKPGKDDYHECGNYRTVSITSCIGKRFEYITSRSLIAILHGSNFDSLQFAYLNGRSATQSMLVLFEKLKMALIEGKVSGAVFFDFKDAFGSVDRNRLRQTDRQTFWHFWKAVPSLSQFPE